MIIAPTGIINPDKFYSSVIDNTETCETFAELIRFQEKKERYYWAQPDDIIFVKSANHYVRSLVQCRTQKKWMNRYCTVKEILTMLPTDSFIRINRFYIINRKYFSHIDENEKLLYLDNGFSISIPHRISPFILHLLRGNSNN